MADDRRHDVLERGERYGSSDGDEFVDSELSEEAAEVLEEEEQDIQERGAALLGNRRRVIGLIAAVVLLIVAIYVILPKVVGIGDSIDKVGDAKWYWVVTAIGFNVLSFVAYMALFRGVLAGRDPADPVHKRLNMRSSYQITMAGFTATILFSAAGAGGVALTYWALRKAGMERRRAACRLVAFTVLLYSMYALALLIFGILLRTGVLPGDNPAGGTIVPAVVAGALLVITALVSTVPEDAERRIRKLGKRGARWARVAAAIVRVPATLASGVRTAIAYLRHPKRQAQAILGAIGWWAGNIGILWSCFQAFGIAVPFGVIVMGYFVGMFANLAPSPAGGVGTVDAGLIAAFVLFGIPIEAVIPAVLLFRVVGFWLPIPVGIHAYLQLRKTVQRWSEEKPGATIKSKVTAAEAT
jgi:uncharacterized protein (TIRG00374 family)